ncbi:MAG: efflux RND transporter permease subunit, partial [Candidatus Obscuribacterales bacterium]|nr:efflux RND transporter permease subunit [Candidatus Obscuribacterales bacterium]
MIDAAIKWSLANRYVVCVLALIVLIWGVCTTVRMPVDVFPDFAPVQVVVMTEAQGFAPLEVESLVTRPLEAALSGTIGVKTVRSTSTIGLSVITIIFNDDTNIFVARQLVAEKIQTVRKKLPDGIDEPALAPITSASGDVIKFGFYQEGTDLRALRTLIDYELKMRLLAVQGVSNVVVIGGDQKQYQVLVDPRKLRQYGVSLAQVAQAAGDSNTNAAGGIMRDRENETLVRGLGRVVDPADIADAVITARDGTPVDIGNVADVRIGSQFKVGDAIVDGHPGIVVTVFKQPGANTLDLTRRIESAVQQVVAAFPADAKMVVTFRQADFIEVAIKNVAEAVAIGALLVVAVLLLFLQQWRTAFIS